jgi:hypothetical protein
MKSGVTWDCNVMKQKKGDAAGRRPETGVFRGCGDTRQKTTDTPDGRIVLASHLTKHDVGAFIPSAVK